MGSFLSSFVRKKKQRADQLEDVFQEIKRQKEARGRTTSYEKSFVAYLVIVSVLLYLVGAAILYFYFCPATWLEGAIELVPFVVFPLIAILVKWLMSSYFSGRRKKFDHRIRVLSEAKKKLLDEIKELEPYNVVQRILEKYDPAALQQNRPPPQNGPGDLRQRRPAPGQIPPAGRGRPPNQVLGPQPPTPLPNSSIPRPGPNPQAGNPQLQSRPPVPRVPHYLPPVNRSITEKLVDYLIGDGPNRRYALICSTCHSHNGMVLQDEFAYTSFKCAYCSALNQARKALPTAPRIEPRVELSIEQQASQRDEDPTTAAANSSDAKEENKNDGAERTITQQSDQVDSQPTGTGDPSGPPKLESALQ